jgi:hypothetical protein
MGRALSKMLALTLVVGLSILGCGGNGSGGERKVARKDCSKVPVIKHFDSDSDTDLAAAKVGDLRFITDAEGRAIKEGMPQSRVFCRLDSPFGGLTRGLALPKCDELHEWAIKGTGPDGDETDLLKYYATWEVCFRNWKVVSTERKAPGQD